MSKECIHFLGHSVYKHNWYICDSSTAFIAMYNLLFLQYCELFCHVSVSSLLEPM